MLSSGGLQYASGRRRIGGFMFRGDQPVTDGGSSAAPASIAMCAASPSSVFDEKSYVGDADAATAPVLLPARRIEQSAVPAIVSLPVLATTTRSARPILWLCRYQLLLVGIDLGAGALAALSAYLLRFGGAPPGGAGWIDVAFGAVLPFAWVVATASNKAYERRFVGVGNAEFERVFRAFLHLTLATVLVFYTADAPVARGLAFPALGLALALDLAGRYGARKALHRRRRRGESMTSVIAVGGLDSLEAFAALLRHDRHAGLQVVGACVPSGSRRDGTVERALATIGVPVLGDIDSIADAVRRCDAHTVAVLSGEISADKLRWISWQLDGTNTDLVVSPGLTEVGGRRVHIQAVAGLPLLHIDEPKLTGLGHLVKSVFDRTAAGLALVLLSPVLLGIGLLVRMTSAGPALFTQTRIGRSGRAFRMVKFRSMVVDAEVRRADLLTANENDGLLFKIRHDPRVTRVGRVLRRFSLDELPQLLNVLTGSMSLVGPRPPLPAEVAQYRDDTRRRLLVRPGLTGLWQISGRSDLSWEESVRLDLRYVESWSLSLDMMVLWKTARAVMRAEGAY